MPDSVIKQSQNNKNSYKFLVSRAQQIDKQLQVKNKQMMKNITESMNQKIELGMRAAKGKN